MRLPNTKKDMISSIAEETGKSRQTVKFVIDNFEKSLRFYLSNPIEAGSAILLKGFGKFTFDKNKARKRHNKLIAKRREQYYDEYLNKFDDE